MPSIRRNSPRAQYSVAAATRPSDGDLLTSLRYAVRPCLFAQAASERKADGAVPPTPLDFSTWEQVDVLPL